MAEMEAKPQCGGGGLGNEEYDLPLHVVALFLVMGASIFGCGFPVVAKKVKWMKIPPKVFFFCKHFGTGVLIATAFVHLLPTAFGSLTDPCLPDLFTKLYAPMPGVIMMGSLFVLFCIELWLNNKTGGHSHGGATGQNIIPSDRQILPPRMMPPVHGMTAPVAIQVPPRPDSAGSHDWVDEKRPYPKEFATDAPTELQPPSEMPPWFIVFYEQYVRQRDEMVAMINRGTPALPRYVETDQPTAVDQSYFDVDGVEQQVDPKVLQRMSLNITLLEGGILFHSVFVGMTISITTDGFIVLLIAILFHQMFEGLGLGSRIAAVPYPKGTIRPWVLVVAFGTTAPIGQAIGLLTRNSYDPNSAFGLIIVGIFNAISSGLLIYASLVDLLYEDFLSDEANETLRMKDKIVAFIYLLMGAAGMSIVGAFA